MKIKYILPTVIIVLLICGVGFFLLNKSPSITIDRPTDIQSQEQTNNQVSEWKKYSNNEFKFSLSYPSDWKVEEKQFPMTDGVNKSVVFSKNGYSVSVGITKSSYMTAVNKSQPLNDWVVYKNTSIPLARHVTPGVGDVMPSLYYQIFTIAPSQQNESEITILDPGVRGANQSIFLTIEFPRELTTINNGSQNNLGLQGVDTKIFGEADKIVASFEME